MIRYNTLFFHNLVNRTDTTHYNAADSFRPCSLAQKQESTLILHKSERKRAGEQNVHHHASVSADGSLEY